MLEDTLEVFAQKFTKPLAVWDKFIEFVAAQSRASVFLELDHKFEWLFADLTFARSVENTYDQTLLKSDYYDHLGELYSDLCQKELGSGNRSSRPLPYSAVENIAKIGVETTQECKRIFLPNADTGRIIMAVHKQTPNAFLFASEKDLRRYRIAYTNLCIHDIYAAIVHADYETHELDIATEAGRENWQFANRWSAQTDNLRLKAPSIHAY